MLSYQHGYHAGNFADVVKHLALTRLLCYLVQKDKPLFYLETHAGRGCYDLSEVMAQKNKEYASGIARIFEQKEALSDDFQTYMNIIAHYNPDGVLRHYPGSPAIAIELLRPQDRLYCCELHPKEYAHLTALRKQHKRVHYSHSDGIQKLNELLPPPEKRGLIFIDPAYECDAEYKDIPKAITKAMVRFPQGVYCLWYPILSDVQHEKWLDRLAKMGAENTLVLEYYQEKTAAHHRMKGCGLWIVNPPYTFEAEMTALLNVCCKRLNPEKASYGVKR